MGKKAKTQSDKASAEATIQTIRRKTRRKHSAEEKIRIVICKSSKLFGHKRH